ncbi:hypothetical protein C3F09_07010 [candidate division GN15 bacterium]|uniref:Zinc-finger domain-containing protein n=1 Tax=candidate division GN15 bacterium TaxID=2072418 RepID=A0A855X703_9BACT|nr:MAG: hypothetical protein C3F09_07010 [candidate division GN15 bacterium]
MISEHLSEDLIQEFLDERAVLPADARAHLLECSECRETLGTYRELFASLDTVRFPELPANFTDRIMEQVETARPLSVRSQETVPQWLWIGATVVGAVAVSAVVMGPAALQNLLAQFTELWSSGVSSARTDISTYAADFNLKPMTAMLSAVTLGGIIIMDRLLVRVRRSRRFMSLMA